MLNNYSKRSSIFYPAENVKGISKRDKALNSIHMSQQNPWVYLLMVYRCAVTLFIHFVDCGFGSLDNRMQHVKSTQPYF